MTELLPNSKSVVKRAARLAREDGKFVLVALIILSAMGATFDSNLSTTDALRASAITGLIQLYLQLLATFRALHRLGLAPPDYNVARPTSGGYPAAVVQGLLWAVGVLAGILLLVVPGVILLVRWGLALPAFAAEKLSVTESLRRSWDLTRNRFWVMLRVGLILIVLYLLPGVVSALFYPAGGRAGVFPAVVVNLMIASAGLSGSYFAVAAYLLFADRRDAVAESSLSEGIQRDTP